MRSAYRALADLHEREALIAWWAARLGPFVARVAPPRRRAMLAAGSAVAAIAYPLRTVYRPIRGIDWIPVEDTLVAAVLLVGFAAACYRAGRAFERLPAAVRRHPQVVLHAWFWLALAILWTIPAGHVHGVLAAAVLALPMLVWRLGYLVLAAARGRVAGTRFCDHLLYLYPVWGGSNTPYGKGLDNLTRHEAASAPALARAQLAGLKLLALALLWALVRDALAAGVYGERQAWGAALFGGWSLGLPRLAGAIAQRRVLAPGTVWASLYGELVMDVLALAIQGHLYVGVLRLLGFDVFRNTYKPLLAETVLEFWNRYHYYFKELMAEMFFLPTFARRLRAWRRLRIVAAVFAAAFIGNVYYHVLKIAPLFAERNLAGAGSVLAPRIVYCVLLATGIACSMLREHARQANDGYRSRIRRVRRIALTITSLAAMRVFANGAPDGVTARAQLLLAAVGLF